MIINGIECNVYGKTVTEWVSNMVQTSDSSGTPIWYDYGVQYDTLKITATITSEDGSSLESLMRTQNISESVNVSFSDGEWLYDYSGDFAILESKQIARVDKSNTEFGYKITLAPVESINMSLLDGDRTQCSGDGYIAYSNTLIPQPAKYATMHNTKKYSGLTNGSSYSVEMPTNEYDTSEFKAVMNSGNMRSLIDDITNTRGGVMFVDFPEGCLPFGLAQGDGRFTVKQSKNKYKITNENGDYWGIDLGVTIAPTSEPAVPYFEAGTEAHPFAESDWDRYLTSPTAEVAFSAEEVTLYCTGLNVGIRYSCEYTGYPVSGEYKVTQIGAITNASYSDVFLYADADNRVVIDNATTAALRLFAKVGGVTKTMDFAGEWVNYDYRIVRWAIDGSSISVTVESYSGGNIATTATVTLDDAINTSIEYGVGMSLWVATIGGIVGNSTCVYDYIRAEGEGFPYTD